MAANKPHSAIDVDCIWHPADRDDPCNRTDQKMGYSKPSGGKFLSPRLSGVIAQQQEWP